MTERDPEITIIFPEIADTTIMCPFTQQRGKMIGDTLLTLMFIVVPLVLLIYFVSIQM
ncbi:MAG: hypothetical protein MUP60_02465 [Candidatus Thorarchaeota archaeon]|nr:hypothetical protein [Candidatus Thorarchaeota archaeon]